MIRKLEPCECGGRPAVKSVSYIKGRWFWVQCDTCLTRSSDLPTLDGAVDNWNQRATQARKGGREESATERGATATRRRAKPATTAEGRTRTPTRQRRK
jgi:hypothetical protein